MVLLKAKSQRRIKTKQRKALTVRLSWPPAKDDGPCTCQICVVERATANAASVADVPDANMLLQHITLLEPAIAAAETCTGVRDTERMRAALQAAHARHAMLMSAFRKAKRKEMDNCLRLKRETEAAERAAAAVKAKSDAVIRRVAASTASAAITAVVSAARQRDRATEAARLASIAAVRTLNKAAAEKARLAREQRDAVVKQAEERARASAKAAAKVASKARAKEVAQAIAAADAQSTTEVKEAKVKVADVKAGGTNRDGCASQAPPPQERVGVKVSADRVRREEGKKERKEKRRVVIKAAALMLTRLARGFLSRRLAVALRAMARFKAAVAPIKTMAPKQQARVTTASPGAVRPIERTRFVSTKVCRDGANCRFLSKFGNCAFVHTPEELATAGAARQAPSPKPVVSPIGSAAARQAAVMASAARPVVQSAASSASSSSRPSTAECPICFHSYSDAKHAVALSCGHVLCDVCASKVETKCFTCGSCVTSLRLRVFV
jgi:hypothetical protein